jgi:opacity protein-like surface antigen
MRTKKTGMPIIMTVIVLCLVPSLAPADVKISLKLQGGLAYLQAGDVNSGTQAFFDWAKFSSIPLTDGAATLGGYQKIKFGYEIYGDLVFEVARHLGIGIGAGFVQSTKTSLMNVWDPNIESGGPSSNILADQNLSAIPVRLGLYLSLPLSGKFNFTANAGASYYLKARYSTDWLVSVSVMDTLGPQTEISTRAQQKKNPFGFQGGLGIEYRLSKRIAILLEAQGQYAKFRGLEGTSLAESGDYGELFPPFSETGKLYYESVPMIPNGPRLIMVQSAPPLGPGGKAREAVVDFSGVSLQAGFRFYF